MAAGNPRLNVPMMNIDGGELRTPPSMRPKMKARVRLRKVIRWKNSRRLLISDV